MLGLNEAALLTLERQIALDFPDVTSLLVARHGQLAFERYFVGQAADPRDTQSVTKSILSLLTGIALQRGLLSSLEQPVLPLLAHIPATIQDSCWAAVQVRHLLTMTCGLPSELTDASYDDAWFTSQDPVRFALEYPLIDAPGTTFRYSNAGVHVLGAALAKAAGQPLATFAQDVLLGPLGVVTPEWPADPCGRPFASGSLHLTSREMLSFGQLTLQRGWWNDTELVPSSWIQQATQPQLQGFEWMEGIPDYGLLWWVAHENGTLGWYATGYGGQYIAIFPEHDLVVVMTGQVTDHPPHRQLIPELLTTVLR
ncbi:serine hydrolase domain-containing protein [Deinococcus oregonensis]|uniref:Serine hydrolase domain-containing protein n=1 Tax=Deinococcus oregonensis TaxID=1805970 RepID=A0ABV6AUC3_9DEIO